MARFQIRVTIDRPLSEVFSTYTQPETFGWTDLRNVRWVSGIPWEVGSRLRMEPDNSYGTVVDQTLTDFEPGRFVGFISHFGGVTMQSQVRFRALSDRQTEIETQVEFIGRFSRVAGLPLRSIIQQGTQHFYEDLKRECERKVGRELRRSTRIPLKVDIETQGIGESLRCVGQTVIVSGHGALISTDLALRQRMGIQLHVILTAKHALANVVYMHPEKPQLCGIELVKPQNIWGLSRPPDDWPAADSRSAPG